jgi:hypothetical protein
MLLQLHERAGPQVGSNLIFHHINPSQCRRSEGDPRLAQPCGGKPGSALVLGYRPAYSPAPLVTAPCEAEPTSLAYLA